MNDSNSARVTIVLVGLFGLHTMTTRVRSVTARAIAARVVSMVRSVRHHDARGSRDGHEPRIRLEAPPAEDDLVARAGCRADQLGEHGDGARPDLHLVLGHAVLLGEAGADGPSRTVRVTVDRNIRDRVEHGRQWVERVLVRRQLERVERRRLALPIWFEGLDIRAKANAGRSHAPQPNSAANRAALTSMAAWADFSSDC